MIPLILLKIGPIVRTFVAERNIMKNGDTTYLPNL